MLTAKGKGWLGVKGIYGTCVHPIACKISWFGFLFCFPCFWARVLPFFLDSFVVCSLHVAYSAACYIQGYFSLYYFIKFIVVFFVPLSQLPRVFSCLSWLPDPLSSYSTQDRVGQGCSSGSQIWSNHNGFWLVLFFISSLTLSCNRSTCL